MDSTSLLRTLIVKHAEVCKSTMLDGLDGKLAYMSQVGDRIMERLALLRREAPARDKDKYLASSLAKHIGISESAISAWKSGSTKGPRPQHLCKAAQYLKTTEWWLAFGKGDPRCDAKGTLKKDQKTGNFPPAYPYPPDTLALIEATEALGHHDMKRLQAVALAFLQGAPDKA